MDKIVVSDLRVATLIGVHAHERKAPQTLHISATLFLDIQKPAVTDAIEDALDYAKVCAMIVDFAEQAQYQLLEAFAQKLIDHLKSTFSLTQIELAITKHPSDIPALGGVTLVLTR